MVARRGNAPAKKSDGGAARGCAGKKWAMGCASLDRQRWRSKGMHQPNGATPNWWVGGECTGKRRDQIGGECAGQMKQRQIGGGSAGNAPAKKWNNTKLARRWNAPAGQRECGAAMRCAGRTKRPRHGNGCIGRTRNGGAVLECTGRTKKGGPVMECTGQKRRRYWRMTRMMSSF